MNKSHIGDFFALFILVPFLLVGCVSNEKLTSVPKKDGAIPNTLVVTPVEQRGWDMGLADAEFDVLEVVSGPYFGKKKRQSFGFVNVDPSDLAGGDIYRAQVHVTATETGELAFIIFDLGEEAIGHVGLPSLHTEAKVIKAGGEKIIINAGADKGVKAGDVFGVFRRKAYIGKVEIQKVYKDRAQGTPMLQWMRGDVKKGDRIKGWRRRWDRGGDSAAGFDKPSTREE